MKTLPHYRSFIVLSLCCTMGLVACSHAPTQPRMEARAQTGSLQVVTKDGKSLLGLQTSHPSYIKEPPALPRIVSISFDDGPHPRNTHHILETLKDARVHATFFLVGEQLEEYPDLARRIAQEGHEIGNHSWSHDPSMFRNARTLMEDTKRAQDSIHMVTGVTPQLYRPPYGARASLFSHFPFPLIYWSIDPQDWRRNATAEVITNHILAEVHPGDIILFHETSTKTVEALPSILEALQAQGFTIVPISELFRFAQEPKNLQKGMVYTEASYDVLLQEQKHTEDY